MSRHSPEAGLPRCRATAAPIPRLSMVSGMLPLSTSGGTIVDPNGMVCRLTGTSLGGFQAVLQLAGTWNAPYRTLHVAGVLHIGIIDRLAQQGFNCVRLLICEDACHPGPKPLGYVNPTLNPDLFHDPADPATVFDAVRIIDRVVAHCGRLGLRVVFDMHALAPNADNITACNGLWYTTPAPDSPAGAMTHSSHDLRNEADWLAAWAALAYRYAGNPVVIGADLVNEPWAATWGDDNPATDIRAAYTRCADAIHAVNPDWLVFCEGIYEVIDFGPEAGGRVGVPWGAGLTRATAHPVTPALPDKLVYSPHLYGPTVAKGAYFAVPNFPADLPSTWNRMFGSLAHDAIAPIWIGEIGDMMTEGANGGSVTPVIHRRSVEWLAALLAYCAGRPGRAALSWSWFCWSTNGYTGTPGSIVNPNLLMGDYDTINEDAMHRITPSLAPLLVADIPCTVTLQIAPATAPTTIAWSTADGTARAGTHYRAAAGSTTFQPGQTTATLTLMLHPANDPGAERTFLLKLAQPHDDPLQITIRYGADVDPRG